MSNYLYVNNIINDAIRTVRAAANFQDNPVEYQESAVRLLNEVIDDSIATGDVIPFTVKTAFNLEAGKSVYTVGQLDGVDVESTPFVDINYVDITISGRRYSLSIQDDQPFYGSNNFTEIQGRPSWVNINRGDDFSEISFLPVPNDNYYCELRGKKEIGQVDFQDYVDFPRWYSSYLRLGLARKLNSFFGLMVWGAMEEKQYLESFNRMLASSKKDYAIKSDAPFTVARGVYTYRLGVISS
jgi:hypothetical protein